MPTTGFGWATGVFCTLVAVFVLCGSGDTTGFEWLLAFAIIVAASIAASAGSVFMGRPWQLFIGLAVLTAGIIVTIVSGSATVWLPTTCWSIDRILGRFVK